MDWKKKTLLIGAGIGLITGIAASWLMIRHAEQNNEEVKLDRQQAAKIGMTVYQVLKKIV